MALSFKLTLHSHFHNLHWNFIRTLCRDIPHSYFTLTFFYEQTLPNFKAKQETSKLLSASVGISSVSDSSPDSHWHPGLIFLNADNFSALCLNLYRVKHLHEKNFITKQYEGQINVKNPFVVKKKSSGKFFKFFIKILEN